MVVTAASSLPLAHTLAHHLESERASVVLAIFRLPPLDRFATTNALVEAISEDPVGVRVAVADACDAVGLSSRAEKAAVIADSIGVVLRHQGRVGDIAPAAELVHHRKHELSRRVPTGCYAIDAGLLLGGFARGSITEITGEAGSGKSHLALQTALHAAACEMVNEQVRQESSPYQLPPLAVVIVSEALPLQRLPELADGAARSSGAATAGVSGSGVLQRVLVRKVAPGYHPLEAAIVDATRLASQPAVVGRLACVVIDSIAASLSHGSSSDGTGGDAPAAKRTGASAESATDAAAQQRLDEASLKAAHVLHTASALKRLADELECAVLAVNQVRATGFSNASSAVTAAASGTSGAGVPLETPALGNAWASSISTRVHLRAQRSDTQVTRTAVIPVSSHLPIKAVSFAITSDGIR